MGGRRLETRAARAALGVAVHLACVAPLGWITARLLAGDIRGEWIKEITHFTGQWGLTFLVATLAVTPARRLFGWNGLQSFRRRLGLWGFAYLVVHFLIYLVLDRQLPFDPVFGWRELVKDVAKRPYITVGFTGLVLLVPLAVTSTQRWIRRMGKRWTQLHALIYPIALAGVVHFMWGVKADRFWPTVAGVIVVLLLALRLVPRTFLERVRRGVTLEALRRDDPAAEAPLGG